MTENHPIREPFRLGEWTVDPSSGDVERGGVRHELQPRVMAVLEFLAARAPHVARKEEILSAVWGDRFITDGVLWRCISRLRTVFDEGTTEPRVIETLKGRGYRLTAKVEFEQTEPVGSTPPSSEQYLESPGGNGSLPPPVVKRWLSIGNMFSRRKT